MNVFDQSKMTMTDLPNSSSMVLPPAVSLTPSTLLNKMEKALPHTPGTGGVMRRVSLRIFVSFLFDGTLVEAIISHPSGSEEGFLHIS